MKTGDIVHTPYGEGQLLLYRATDDIYVVQLQGALLYASRETLEEMRAVTIPPLSVETTTTTEHDIPLCRRWKSPTKEKNGNNNNTSMTMELNVAYEALEKMRQLNLEVQCKEMGFDGFDLHRCTTCLLQEAKRQQELRKKQQQSQFLDQNGGNKKWFQRSSSSTVSSSGTAALSMSTHGSIGNGSHHNGTQPVSVQKVAKKGISCLVCGSPACKSHSCPTFRKEGITLCLDCRQLFKLEFVIDCLTCSVEERAKKLGRMVDTYDRTLLLLQYSSQFIEDVAVTLQETTARQNKVHVGSSASGIMSGALGIAAAATIFTPVGPPLLIASLLFGGSATAMQTGTEVRNYFSDSNRLADRILALHGMLRSILRLTGTLRNAMLRDSVMHMEQYDQLQRIEYPEENDTFSKHSTELMAGISFSKSAASTKEPDKLVASASNLGAKDAVTLMDNGSSTRHGRILTRGSINAMHAARFIQFAGGALAACTFLLEAQVMTQTISSIRKGNPCEKADLLLQVQDSLEAGDLPLTTLLDQECRRYLSIVAQRKRAIDEKEVVDIFVELSNEAKSLMDQNNLFLESNEKMSTSLLLDAMATSSSSSSSSSSDDSDSSENSSGELKTEESAERIKSPSNNGKEEKFASLVTTNSNESTVGTSKSFDEDEDIVGRLVDDATDKAIAKNEAPAPKKRVGLFGMFAGTRSASSDKDDDANLYAPIPEDPSATLQKKATSSAPAATQKKSGLFLSRFTSRTTQLPTKPEEAQAEDEYEPSPFMCDDIIMNVNISDDATASVPVPQSAISFLDRYVFEEDAQSSGPPSRTPPKKSSPARHYSPAPPPVAAHSSNQEERMTPAEIDDIIDNLIV